MMIRLSWFAAWISCLRMPEIGRSMGMDMVMSMNAQAAAILNFE